MDKCTGGCCADLGRCGACSGKKWCGCPCSLGGWGGRRDLEADDGEGAVGQQGRRTLGIVHVIALMFFTVSGGSVGSEGIISSLGPLPGLLGLAIFPLLVTLPLGLISAELSTAFPTSGSLYYVVLRGFWLEDGVPQSLLFLLCGRHGLCNLSNPLCRISIGHFFDEVSPVAEWFVKFGFNLIFILAVFRGDDRGQICCLAVNHRLCTFPRALFCLYPSHEEGIPLPNVE